MKPIITKNTKIEPVKIEAYKCPICPRLIIGTYDEALTHVSQPIIRFPVGLAIRRDIVYPLDQIFLLTSEHKQLNSDHSAIYSALVFKDYESPSYRHLGAKSLLHGFYDGSCRLLDKNSFNQFLCLYKSKKEELEDSQITPMRTTFELERIVRNRK